MSATLSVLIPTSITDSMLSSSTIGEPATGEAAWNAATNYAVGAQVIRTTTHRIYENLISGVDATLPENATAQFLTNPRWLDLGPTNRWAMFDQLVSTSSSGVTPLTVVLKPGFFNALAMFGLNANHVTVTVKDAPGGNVIYTYSGTLEGSMPGDYYEYFFSPFTPLKDLVLSGIDQYNNAELTITLTAGTGSTVSCGVLAVGDLRPLGTTQYGAKAKPKTYSYISTDQYGITTIVRRKASKDLSATAWVALAEANAVVDAINDLLDVPCVWVCSDDTAYAGLRVFGLGSGEMSYDYPDVCQLSLTVQGLI